MDRQRQIELHLTDVAEGQKTIADLVAQKALYEGKNSWLTEIITWHRDNPIGRVLADLYESIGEALIILQQEGRQVC